MEREGQPCKADPHTYSPVTGWLDSTRLAIAYVMEMSKKLTKRQCEVLQWALHGKKRWETGEILGISENTVMTCRADIFRKLHVNNIIAACVIAYEQGLIQLPEPVIWPKAKPVRKTGADRVREYLRECKEPQTYGRIAKQLGVTRSTVVGVMARLAK